MASGRVRDKLGEMMERGRRNPGYHVPGKAESEFRQPTDSGIFFKMTEEELREDIMATHAQVKAQIQAEEG